MRTVRVLGIFVLFLTAVGTWGQKATPKNGLKAGLKGEYFNGPNFERKVLTRIDPTVDFDWNWQLAAPGVQHEYFSVRWTGKLYAPVSGKYRFSALADDGVRVWVNGRKVIDEWRKQDDSQFIGEIVLLGRQFYDLRIEYYNDWKGSIISVLWELPTEKRLPGFHSKPSQVIPAKYMAPVTYPSSRLTFANERVFVKTKPVVGRSPVSSALPVATRPVVSDKRSASTAVLAVSNAKAKPLSALPDSVYVSPPAGPLVARPFDNLRPGESVVLRHVQFEQSSYVLLSESSVELNKLVQALNQHPLWRVEIAGHTDNVGDPRLNMALSENRAKVVATYLTRHGITESRIDTKGYGGKRPVADNTVERERLKNRRVAITIQ